VTRCRTGGAPIAFCIDTLRVLLLQYMASLLRVFFEFLRRLCFPRDYTKCCSGHWVSFLAFIFRKLGLGRKRPGTFRKTRSAEPSFPCEKEGTRGYSVLGSLTNFREYVVAASAVPTSASLTSLHERAPGQTPTATPPGTITPTDPATGSVTADRAPPDFDIYRPGNLSSTNLSILSRASDRLSILTQSRELMGSRLSQPSRRPRAIYRQFGLGPKLPPSRSVPVPADILEDAPLSPTTSSVISDFYLPEGRFIALIHSDQVPRYSKDIKMQVNYIVLLLRP
jgi:hypothetical protein